MKEEYTELSQLLKDITIAENDELRKRRKEQQDKIKDTEMRKAALETHSSENVF